MLRIAERSSADTESRDGLLELLPVLRSSTQLEVLVAADLVWQGGDGDGVGEVAGIEVR